jgi:hypothetical protein
MRIWIKREDVRLGDAVVDFRRGPQHPGFYETNLMHYRKEITEDYLNRHKDRYKHDDLYPEIQVERSEPVESTIDVWARVAGAIRTSVKYQVHEPKEAGVDWEKSATAFKEWRQASKPQNFGSPQPRKVTSADGLTGRQCYERYLDNMREAANPDGTPRRWLLTRAQKALAQCMWEVELKGKQREQKTVDATRAVSVVIEEDND